MMVSFAGLTDSHQELGQRVGTGQSREELTKSLEILTALPENINLRGFYSCVLAFYAL